MRRRPEGDEGVGCSSDESSAGETRMFLAHQLCSSKGRAGRTLPENEKRREEAEVAVQVRYHGKRENCQNSQNKHSGNHFKGVESLPSGIP